jgi:hypothetical protein
MQIATTDSSALVLCLDPAGLNITARPTSKFMRWLTHFNIDLADTRFLFEIDTTPAKFEIEFKNDADAVNFRLSWPDFN